LLHELVRIATCFVHTQNAKKSEPEGTTNEPNSVKKRRTFGLLGLVSALFAQAKVELKPRNARFWLVAPRDHAIVHTWNRKQSLRKMTGNHKQLEGLLVKLQQAQPVGSFLHKGWTMSSTRRFMSLGMVSGPRKVSKR
jgi:hypothetical protein